MRVGWIAFASVLAWCGQALAQSGAAPGYVTSTVAEGGALDQPAGITFDAGGHIIVANSKSLISGVADPGSILTISATTGAVSTWAAGDFRGPLGAAISPGSAFGFGGELFTSLEDADEAGI